MMQCWTEDHDDGHSAELAMALTLECLEGMAVCLEDLRSHFSSESGDLPSMRTLDAPHSRIHRGFCYHIGKTCHRRKI